MFFGVNKVMYVEGLFTIVFVYKVNNSCKVEIHVCTVIDNTKLITKYN